MKITKLDDFNEGFKVAPRKAHRQPAVKVRTNQRSPNTTLAKVRRDLKKNGVIRVSDYDSESAVKNGIGKLRMLFWQIEAVKEGRKAVGYKLINKQ